MEVSNESNMGLTTAGRKRPEVHKINLPDEEHRIADIL